MRQGRRAIISAMAGLCSVGAGGAVALPRTVCGETPAHTATLCQRILDLLRGTAKGRVVREGVVVVRDFRSKKNIVVRAGQTYLARAG